MQNVVLMILGMEDIIRNFRCKCLGPYTTNVNENAFWSCVVGALVCVVVDVADVVLV